MAVKGQGDRHEMAFRCEPAQMPYDGKVPFVHTVEITYHGSLAVSSQQRLYGGLPLVAFRVMESLYPVAFSGTAVLL